ncbi:ATP-binding protein [Streptomyces sp. 8K308]|uniref:ATP-binding protein n=1 Tax=Streptomyces sp. 8K308 TaxID=2530388 RepID=UPI0010474F2A|nr:ATP-binding protein [Streptomyces sp. 8K308]TDC13473.1 ATP-binding protein [Streptomyces sp. 8K308]
MQSHSAYTTTGVLVRLSPAAAAPGPRSAALPRTRLHLVTERLRGLDSEGGLMLCSSFGRFPGVVRLIRNVAAELAECPGYFDQVDDVRLLASELATNAARHSHGDITLTVRRRVDRALFLAVGDESPETPSRRVAAPDDEHGRGLELVRLLTAEWGIVSTGHASKYVWCVLPTPPHLDASSTCLASEFLDGAHTPELREL